MPVIKEYSPNVGAAGVPARSTAAPISDGGVGNATQRLGESLTNFGEAIQKRNEQNELSDLNKHFARIQNQFTAKWNETIRTADPSDTEVASRFIKDFDDEVAPLGETVSTNAARKQFQLNYEKMKGHFSQTAMAGQVELAGIKAKEDYLAVRDNLTASLFNDPSSFEFSAQNHDSAIDTLVNSGRLPRHAAEELKREGKRDLAKSTLRGWMNLDPEGTKQEIASGKWDQYLDGDLKRQMVGEAEQAVRGLEIEEERKKREADKAKAERQDVIQNEFLAKMQKGKLTAKDILNSDLEAFGQGSKHQFLQMLEQDAKQGTSIKTDPSVMRDTFDRIHLPDSDPRKIRNENELNALFGRGLSMESLNQLRAEIQGKKTTAGQIEGDLKKGVLDMAKSQLTRTNPMFGFQDPAGDEQYQKFMTFFLTEFEAQKAKGKTASELLNPDSKDYLGHHIRRFRRTPQEIMESMSGMSRGTPQPTPVDTFGDPLSTAAPAATNPKARKPGESIADWKKRTQGN